MKETLLGNTYEDRIRATERSKGDQMRAALVEIREKAATMENGGAWAAGLANLCLATLKD